MAEAAFDISGLKPLDATGLAPVDTDAEQANKPLDVRGLKLLDTTGLKPVAPGRVTQNPAFTAPDEPSKTLAPSLSEYGVTDETPSGPTPQPVHDVLAAAGRGAAQGFGEQSVGFSEENRTNYPKTYLLWQPVAAPADVAYRAPGAVIGALSSAAAEAYRQFGGSDAWADRLDRDLRIIGQGAMVEPMFGNHRNVGTPEVVEKPLNVAQFLDRVDAVDSPVVADFQKKTLVQFGMDPAAVDAMTPADRQAAFKAKIAEGGFGNAGSQPSGPPRALPAPETAAQPTAAARSAEEPAVAPAAPPVDIKVNIPERDGLLGYGYTDAQIEAMSPAQRAAEYENAVAAGAVTPPAPVAQPAPEVAPAAPVATVAAPPVSAPAPAPEPAAVAPAAPPPTSVAAPPPPAPAEPVAAQPIAPTPPPVMPSGHQSLAELLADPRSAKEIRADMEAAKTWQPTEDWQPVPRGAALDPTLEVRNLPDGAQEARIAPEPGSREAPVDLKTSADVTAGAERTAEPTPAQAEAGNYAKRHVTWNGLDITVETEAGQARTGVGPDGVPWSVTLQSPYGYIKGTKGRDGDHLDLYVGPHPESPTAYVFDQVDPDTRQPDEHKLVIGARTPDEAKAIYEARFSDGSGPARWGAVTEMSVPELKAWLAKGDTEKPLAYEPPKPIAAQKEGAPLSLMQFLASKGGIRDDGGELRHMGLEGKFIPGYGRLVRSSGRYLDNAREIAAEAGYPVGAHSFGTADERIAGSTVNDLLDLLHAENHGNRVYSDEDRAALQRREDVVAAKVNKARAKEVETEVRDIAQRLEITNLTDAEVQSVVGQVMTHNVHPEDALADVLERGTLAGEDYLVGLEPHEAIDEHAASEAVAAGAHPARTENAQTRQHAAEPHAGPTEGSAPAREQPGGVEHAAPETKGVAPLKPAPSPDELEIPSFLRRLKDEPKPAAEATPEPAPVPEVTPAETPTVRTPESEIKAEADKRWRNWTPGKNAAGQTLLTRPRLTTFIREVRKERRVAEREEAKARAAEAKAAAKTAAKEQRAAERAKAKEAAPEPRPEGEASNSSAYNSVALARIFERDLADGKPITAMYMQHKATEAFGGKLSEGKFDRKDMQDALELAVNMLVKDTRHLRVDSPDPRHAIKMLSDVLDELPAQRVRSEEQQRFQQFSTPPNYAAAAVYAANLRPGDTMLEPSAGTGSIVAAASRPGVEIVANELSERRADMLRHLMGDKAEIFHENAEQLDNILPASIKPTVVVMNPPFSQTAGRMGDKKVLETAQVHIEQALNRLEPGGRLVAIVGQGMTLGAPRHRAWFQRIGAENAIRASIGVEGKVYEKYGTTFGTRLYVIDKVEPTGERPVSVDVHSIDELMHALESIRNVRPELRQTEQGRAGAAEGSESGRAAASSVSSEPRGMGTGERSAGRVAEPGSARDRGTGEHPVRVEAGERNDVAPVQSERAGQSRAGSEPAPISATGPEAGSRAGAQRDLQPAASGQSSTPAGSQRIDLEAAAPGTQKASEGLSESLYDAYEPKRARVKGAKPHPGPLVESASMASVPPPPATYTPHLPRDVIDKGQLSSAQLEPVIYAGQAHSKMLPAAEDATPKRRGYFIGDGTGVGKGREVAGIILDNWSQGRTKAVWVSEKRTLLQDAKRDWKGLGQNDSIVFDVGKVKTGEPVTAAKGIGFITYDTLKGGMSDQAAIAKGGFIRKQPVSVNGQSGEVARIVPGKRGAQAQITVKLANNTEITVPANEVKAEGETSVKSRVDQLVDWFGKDFDGVIAFDEAHNMGNAAATKGARGLKDAAQKALAGLELQDRLPNARVVYVSATGATEVSNLAYADRLGLWGRGTPFASREAFVSEVEKGGIAAMELIARDMKQLGLYTARNLSYDGVEYNRIEHTLDASQREIYDTLAEAWQGVLRNINQALEVTGGNKDSKAKSSAMSAFWGGHQRFFNQIVTSMQMPSVIKAVEKDLAAGRQAVLQLTNTNEASQERAAAKAETAEDIEDLDITPRDQIIQLVENSFPTQQYEKYVDENGKERSRPVVDADGNPVQNRQAVRMRDALIDRLASVRVPQGPLDMVLDHFGTDVVAEVTGRGRRFVMKADEKTGERRRMEESRPGSANLAETDAFQSGKKKVLVFSEAGGTGRSYHADNTSASKDARRAHYLVQGGWRADKAVQGFGRTHRTNQASAPIVSLVTTDLQGQKRFISSIARRLAQLGALTKGSRQAGDQGIFSARDNLESTEAKQALQGLYRDLIYGNVDGVTINDFEQQTGLKLRNQDEEGRSSGMKMELPPITQFLNRLLSLKIDTQNAVFNAFSDRLDAVIEARAQAGLLDVGLETVKADKITVDGEKTVHTVEESGAETKYVKLKVSDKFVPIRFYDVAKNASRPVKFWLKSERGKVYGVAEAPNLTDENGNVSAQYRIINPVSGSRIVAQNVIDGRGSKWSKIDQGEAQRLWKNEIDAAPEYTTRDLHLITGAILPIWDRLGGSTRVVRLQTDEGERYIGRVVPKNQLASTLKRLGADEAAQQVTPDALFTGIMAGGRATLANGWTLSRRVVAGEQRIELKGPAAFSEAQEIKTDGVFSERINYENRYFVPTDPGEGQRVLTKLTQYRPVTELSEAGGRASDAAITGDEMFKLREAADVTPAFADSIAETSKALRAELDRMGLKDVALELPGKIERYLDGSLAKADASYLDGVIRVALDTEGKGKVLSHESVHAIRDMGLFTNGEWGILSRAADKWRAKHNIDERYSGFSEDVKTEEAVAHAYADWAGGERVSTDGRIARLFRRIREFFERLGNVLRGKGFKSAEDVFRSVKEGEVGARPRNADIPKGTPRFAERDLFKTEPGAEGKPQTIIPGAEKISDKQLAERKSAEPLKPTKDQKTVGDLPLFSDKPAQGEMFALRHGPIAEKVGALRTVAEKAMELADEATMKVAPMAVGSMEAQAAAKDYANAVRQARHQWSRRDDLIKQNFTPEQRARMWGAADHESVALQRGKKPNAGEGKAALTDPERKLTESLQDEANRTWAGAQDVGIVEGEGLPSYVPRMMVIMNEAGGFERAPRGDGYSGNPEGIGRGFRTTTGQTKQRKYMTAEETEAAMKARFGPNAKIAKDIRALALGTAKLQEAIAARALVNKIKSIGNMAGEVTVSEGAEPAEGRWFTLDHPAFKTYRPVLKKNDTTGKWENAKYDDGTPAFERVPIYIRSDFKGPLLAVLGKDSGKIYNGLMALKGKAMSMVMYSPVIHNMVEYSRALPAYPLKVASTFIYFEGNRAKHDPAQMREAINAGLVPIGKRFFNQDITSVMEEPTLAPGQRSWTAQVLGFIPGLFDRGAGDAVKRAVDKAGDFWHNKLLWDRVADLQMGLYVNMRRDLIAKGHDAQTASRVAAHFANRYAGALPIEAMSSGARKLANLILFSRTFTFGNLGAMKDMLTGLPRDVQAQIMRDAEPEALGKIKTFAKRKSMAILMLDIALGIITTSLMQDAFKKLRGEKDWLGENGLFADYYRRFIDLIDHTKDHPADTALHPINSLWKLSSTASNEPRKREGMEARILLYYDQRGRAVYGRNPMGKIGEEFTGWPTAPGDMILRKLGTFTRPALQVMMNDKYAGAGFDRPTPIWRPNPEGAEWFKNAGRIAKTFAEAQLPGEAIHSGFDLADDTSKKDPFTSKLKILAPFAGISVSQGHPEGMRGALQAEKGRGKALDKALSR